LLNRVTVAALFVFPVRPTVHVVVPLLKRIDGEHEKRFNLTVLTRFKLVEMDAEAVVAVSTA